jgi:hypothetical protein
MKQAFYGQINLTKLGIIVRQHPELVKEYDSKKEGKQKVINVNILEKDEADRFGNTACIVVSCNRDKQKLPTGAYYIADIKPSTPKSEDKKPSFDDPIPTLPTENDDIPF